MRVLVEELVGISVKLVAVKANNSEIKMNGLSMATETPANFHESSRTT